MRGVRDDAAPAAQQLGGVRRRGDDRRLLDDHRQEAIHVVDAEVRRHPDGQVEQPDHVLDHLVRRRQTARVRVREYGHVFVRGLPEGGHLGQALGHGPSIETRDARGAVG